ncbi:MAG: dodecin domain-containing protein [Calditrichaeota bacterium]|nr:MAG: dodecin domain-containing protein [Calditrichota bacterium]
MSGYIERGAVKVIEVVGISQTSFDDAVSQAVKKASESVHGITGVEVLKFMASVKDGGLTQYSKSRSRSSNITQNTIRRA